MHGVELTDDALRSSDAVVIVTDHDNVDYQRVVDLAPVVVDARNATRNLSSQGWRTPTSGSCVTPTLPFPANHHPG